MDKEDIKLSSELEIGNVRFQIVSHFYTAGSDTIDEKLVKLMEGGSGCL